VRTSILAALVLALALSPAMAGAADGLVATASIGAGGELGLDHGDTGVVELELVGGWQFEEAGLRPEVGAVIGFQPDGNFALRPGVRWTLPNVPLQLRAALDFSSSRGGFGARWLLLGAAYELRVTGVFGLFAGVDSGFPLAQDAGVPLMARFGASFRF
jgi:hypothetical protein